MSKRQAVLEAGFSPSTAHNATVNVFNKPIVQTWLDNYKYTLAKNKINPQRLASTLDKLLDDKDSRIKLDTVRTLHDVFGVKDKPIEGLKRRMTLEEFEDKNL